MSINVSPFPLVEYQHYLKTAVGLGENSIRTYLLALRRMMKHLDEHDLRDPQMIALYRGSLSMQLRGAQGVAWGHYRDFMRTQGVENLPETPHTPPVRLPHPLYPYGLNILSKQNPSVIANYAPHEVPQDMRDDMAAVRRFATMTGQGRPSFASGHRAFPWDEWVLHELIRAEDKMTKKLGIEVVFSDFVSTLSQTSETELREAGQEKRFTADLMLFYRIFEEQRHKLARRMHFKKEMKDLCESIQVTPNVGTHWELVRKKLLEAIRGPRMLDLEYEYRLEDWRWYGGGLIFW